MKALAVLALVLLASCSHAPTTRAPVSDRAPTAQAVKPTPKPPAKESAVATKEADWRPRTHTVQQGETLYGIALEYGQDYRDLAAWNGIAPPYVIRVGQVLRLTPPEGEETRALPPAVPAEPKPLGSGGPIVLKTEPKALKQPYGEATLDGAAKPAAKDSEAAMVTPRPEAARAENGTAKAAEPAPAGDEGDEDRVDWGWPARGSLLARFGENGGNKGIDIAGQRGQPVLAAAGGRVIHVGTTLRGYGKLIIIKHNKGYFSVYAHNSEILVKEGQNVVRGQKIAEMGDSDADRVKLHFEIRRLGRPVDPLKYLPTADRAS